MCRVISRLAQQWNLQRDLGRGRGACPGVWLHAGHTVSDLQTSWLHLKLDHFLSNYNYNKVLKVFFFFFIKLPAFVSEVKFQGSHHLSGVERIQSLHFLSFSAFLESSEGNTRDQWGDMRNHLHQCDRCCVTPQYTTTKKVDFVKVLSTRSPAVNVRSQNKSTLLSLFHSVAFSHCISPHRNGFWLLCKLCEPSSLADDRGSRGSGSVPSRPRPGWVGWVSDEGRLDGWLPAGRGREALYGSDEGWGDEEATLSWLRVSLDASLWNGLLAGGAPKPWGRKTTSC